MSPPPACSPCSPCSPAHKRCKRPPCADDADGQLVCRFCLGTDEETEENDEFVAPCPCRGSAKYVHLGCLIQAFESRGNWHNFKCPTCQQVYQGRALRELAQLSYNQMVKEFGSKSVKVAHSLCYLAQALIQLGSARESKELLEECLAIEENHYGKGHVATAATLSELASASGKLGDVQRRKDLLERSLSIKEKHYGKGHISTAVTLNNLATVHSELGDVHQERELLEQSLAIKEHHFGKNHLQSSATLVNLAGVHSELGDAQQAHALLSHCLNIEEQHFGLGHIETAITLNNLALACGETGDLKGMKERLEQSLAIKQAHFGIDHFESCLTLANLSMAWGVLGKSDFAKSFGNRALVACGSRENPSSRSHAVVLFRTAAVHYALGDTSLAEELTSRGLHMLDKVLGQTASARVLALERTRTSRIWLVAARRDVLNWLEIAWANERLAKLRGLFAEEAITKSVSDSEFELADPPFNIIADERVEFAINEYMSKDWRGGRRTISDASTASTSTTITV